MKRIVYLISFVVVLSSCGQQPKNKTEKISNVVKTFKKVDKKQAMSKPNVVALPVTGKVDLSTMKTDSTNHYSFENCHGTVVQLSKGNSLIVIDSLNCEEEAWQYTIFQLKDKKISVVDIQKLGMVLVPGKKNYSYLQTEKVYDYTTSPATLMTRSDTLESFTRQPLSKPFKKETLQNEEESLKLWNMRLNGKWRLK